MVSLVSSIDSFGRLLTYSPLQNWSSVMFTGVAAIAIADYLIRGKRQYIPPVRHINKI